MRSIKHVLLVLLVVASTIAVGCGGATVSKSSTTGPRTDKTYETFEIPGEIPPGEKTLFERDLELLPVKHPDRLALRDKLVKLVAKEFDALEDSDKAGRLELFEQALALHDASDFKPGGVAADVEPMAKWVAEVFGKRGDEAVVLAALRFLMLQNPGNAKIKANYLELYEWSESIRKNIPNPVDRLSSLINLYQRMVELVPDREVVENLASLYVQRHKLVMAIFSSEAGFGGQLRPMEILMQSRIIQNLPIELLYVFSLAGDPAGARIHLEELTSSGGRIIEYLELLDRIFQGEDEADSYFTLANHLYQINPRASLKAFIRAREADPEDSRFPLFIGKLYEEMGRSECAFDFFVEAAEIAPSQDVYIQVLDLYQRALLRVSTKNLPSSTKRAIEVGDRLVKQVLELYPDDDGSDLRPIVASFIYTVGEIEFNNGEIDSSIDHLKQSFEVMGNLRALVKLSEVYYMLGQFKEGLDALDKVAKLLPKGQTPAGYWQAILLENRGNLTDMLGKKDDALRHYRDALIQWDSANVPPEQAPIIAIRRGILLDRLGDLKGSIESFTQAVRLDPNRESTYAQLISFLVIRGRLEDAKVFYRLAHNQDQIEDMWKIYYSLWVEGLSLRTTKASFSLAGGYLKHSNGDTWQDSLAQFFSGEIKEDELAKKVTNSSEQTELEYYVALKAMTQGENASATKRLQKVLASKLLGFFEYQMAFAILQNNPGIQAP